MKTLGGAQGKRYSLANSRIMIHQPLGGAQGQAAGATAAASLLSPWLHTPLVQPGWTAIGAAVEVSALCCHAE